MYDDFDYFLVKTCGFLPEVENGNITYHGEPATCGSYARSQCDRGYVRTSGDEWRHCGTNSQWSGTAIKCSSMSCILH